MGNLEREDMINNFELNKDKLSKLTRKVILIGGIISTLLTGGCKTKDSSSVDVKPTIEPSAEPTTTPSTEPTVEPTFDPASEDGDYRAYKVAFSGDDIGNVPKFDSEVQVKYDSQASSLDGYIYYETPWKEHTDKYNPLDFDPEHADYPWVRAIYKYELPKYYDYEEFKTAIKYCIHDYDYYAYIFGIPGKEQPIDCYYEFSYEKTPEFDDHFRISGEVYLIQEVVKVK